MRSPSLTKSHVFAGAGAESSGRGPGAVTGGAVRTGYVCVAPIAHAPVRARPRAVLAVIGAGAVATVWLWWHGTPAVTGSATG